MRITPKQAQQVRRVAELPGVAEAIQAQITHELGLLTNAIELADLYRGQGRVQALTDLLAVIQQD